VLWKLNGTLIDIDGDTRLSVIPPGNLRLRFIRKSDEGAYVCMAKNEGGEYSSRPAFLTVLGLYFIAYTTTTCLYYYHMLILLPHAYSHVICLSLYHMLI